METNLFGTIIKDEKRCPYAAEILIDENRYENKSLSPNGFFCSIGGKDRGQKTAWANSKCFSTDHKNCRIYSEQFQIEEEEKRQREKGSLKSYITGIATLCVIYAILQVVGGRELIIKKVGIALALLVVGSFILFHVLKLLNFSGIRRKRISVGSKFILFLLSISAFVTGILVSLAIGIGGSTLSSLVVIFLGFGFSVILILLSLIKIIKGKTPISQLLFYLILIIIFPIAATILGKSI